MAKRTLTPLFARDRTAAQLLDMTPSEFLALVNAGALPRPTRVGNFERWSVADLDAILRGAIPKPTEDFVL